MKLRNRGIIGSWRNGARRTLGGFGNTMFILGIFYMNIHLWFDGQTYTMSNGDPFALWWMGITIAAVLCWIADRHTGEEYVLAWILDDEEVAY